MRLRFILAAVSAMSAAGAAAAQTTYQPPAGVAAQQQQQDVAECRNYATSLSGFDPAVSQPPQRVERRGRETVKGAAIGAGAGAILGEVIGDRAGLGALAGAGAGALGGRVARANSNEQDAAEFQARLAAYEESKLSFDNAFGSCLTGRGYTAVAAPVSAY
ncbi:MAG: YMGG-like glycine zipper-containing protein [Maricaulaceae bacterium]